MIQERKNAIALLRNVLHPGDTVTCVLRHVSASGMSRDIDFFYFDKIVEGGRWRLSRYIGEAIGVSFNKKLGCLHVMGCGMDMGEAIVHELARTLWPDGFTCTGTGTGKVRQCPSNDHCNGDCDYEPHHHHDGGYALRSEWL